MGPFGSFSDLLTALRRQAVPMALVLLVGLPLVYLFAATRPKLYEATAAIQIETPQVAAPVAGTLGAPPDNQLDLIQQQLLTRENLLNLIAELGLFPLAQSDLERVGALRGAITITKMVDPAQAWRPDVEPTGLLITVRLDDPEAVAAVANALVDRVMTEARLRAETRANRTLDFLLAEEARVAAEIAAIEDRIAAFRAEHVDSLPESLGAQRDRLTRLTEQRIALDRELIALAQASDRQRPEEVARQTALLEGQRALVDQNVAGIEAALAEGPSVERELTALTRTLSQLDAEYAVITTRRTEAAMTQLIEARDEAERFVVLESAVPPEAPVSASRTRLAIAGGFAVGLLALGLGIAREFAGTTIRTAAQLQAQLGIEPVIVVPYLSNARTRRRRRLWQGLSVAAVLAAASAVVAWIGRGGGGARIGS